MTLALAAFAVPYVAHAEAMFLAGANSAATGSNYMYAGALAPLKGDLANGLIGRVWLDRVGYSFDSAGTEVDATLISASGSLGWQWSEQQHRAGMFLTVSDQDGRFSPDQPTNRDRGNEWFGRVELTGGVTEGPWRFDADAVLTPALHGYWTRLTALRTTWGPLAIGPEAMFHGNVDYHATQVGLALDGLKVATDGEVGFSIGYIENTSNRGGYAGLRFSKLLR